MKKYYFYSKNDPKQEPILTSQSNSRLEAARNFADRKDFTLKQFLTLYSVSK